MIRTIVVGVDGSAASLDALRWAQGVAGPDTRVRAVAAWTYPSDMTTGMGMGMDGAYLANTIPVEVMEENVADLVGVGGDVARQAQIEQRQGPARARMHRIVNEGTGQDRLADTNGAGDDVGYGNHDAELIEGHRLTVDRQRYFMGALE